MARPTGLKRAGAFSLVTPLMEKNLVPGAKLSVSDSLDSHTPVTLEKLQKNSGWGNDCGGQMVGRGQAVSSSLLSVQGQHGTGVLSLGGQLSCPQPP